jgi:bifunctional non-homologous end joining protein LigD
MRPMLATPGTPPAGDEWCHEVKWDGMRILADVNGGVLRLFSRTGRDVTSTFPELGALATKLHDALLDGEVIALQDGSPSFAALAERMHVSDARRAGQLAESSPVSVMTFDLLRLYGVELLKRPLEQRRSSLDKLELPEANWQLSPIYADGAALFTATAEQGLEGVVAKRRTSTYQPGRRSTDWLKAAHRLHQACVVGGWRPEVGNPSQIGALLIGVPDPSGALTFAGRVGSGINRRIAQDLIRDLKPLPAPPFDTEVPAIDAQGAVWCMPELVVEVRHTGWTAGGRLRQPVFRGRRTDLAADQVRRES